MEEPLRLAEELAEVIRIAYSKGLTTGGGGNASLRTSKGILITPTGKFKGKLRGEDILLIDEEGNVLRGSGKPSTEWRMHVMTYKFRKDVRSILHCHHPLTTALTLSRTASSLNEALKEYMTEEASILIGKLGVVPWKPFGTLELAEVVSEYLRDCNAVLIEKHGAVVVAEDHWRALAAMESLVEVLEIYFYSKLLDL